MLSNILYNICTISGIGFSVGILSLTIHDLYRIHTRQYVRPIVNISQVFNTGFYIGTAIGVAYIINGKPLLCNVLSC